ncbi:lipase maturation factor 2-like [Bradysia coprophila]|uniref:lipase maturation factor 2-like n=1 Tax=Bradysia coprophila TaxID=38358 RepID=UPI00187DC9D7|nr:lipase maturation factor 2-like [Bradysia coprophila]
MTDARKSSGQGDGITRTRNLILRGMSTIYLIAFVSFYYQSTGLFGNNGISPARLQIESPAKDLRSNIVRKPTLLHLAPYCGLDVEYMIDMIALLGSIISFAGLMTQRVCILPTFAVLWCLYGSLIQIAQLFASDSDYLLVEAGFIMIMLAPLTRSNQASSSDKVILIVLRWLLMRYFFATGAAKILSRCPHWWNFTALSHYFETMPLPTVLAWVSHNFLANWLKITTIFSNVTELGAVWLFFFPHRTIRRYAFYWLVFFQLNIIMTGNFGFLNLMLLVLLLCLVDDAFITQRKCGWTIVHMVKVLVISYVMFFGIGWIISSSVDALKFEEKYLEILRQSIKPAPLLATFVIISTFLINLVSHRTIIQTRTFFQKIYGANILLSFSIIAISMVLVSMVPHGNIDSSTNITNSDLGTFYQQIKKFNIINEYGTTFRRMRTERFEIIYEHSDNLEGPWTEYDFLYKPSNVNSTLPFAGPYLPRIDFKLYESATSHYRKEVWTMSLAYRLLQGNPHVLALLGDQSTVATTPNYVRAVLYKFRYTTHFRTPQIYWIRLKMIEYFPAFSLDTISPYLRSMKISPNFRETEVESKTVKMLLDNLRIQIRSVEGSALIFGILLAGFAINVSKRMYRSLSYVE